MTKDAKLLRNALANPGGLRFAQLCRLAENFGFVQSGGRGSHRVYKHAGCKRILIFQDDKGNAQAYQVKQLLQALREMGLIEGEGATASG